MITEGYLQTILQGNNVPSYLYPAMLCEAILQREGVAIVKLISRWPLKYLHVYEVLPLEDYLDDDYLNQRLDNTENTTLLDCFIFGLLKLKPGNKLRFVDFTKLDKGMLSIYNYKVSIMMYLLQELKVLISIILSSPK